MAYRLPAREHSYNDNNNSISISISNSNNNNRNGDFQQHLRRPFAGQYEIMSKLFIENLSSLVDEAVLKKRFQVFGEIEELTITTCSDVLIRRVGICKYVHEDDALAAFQGMNDRNFEGQPLKITLSSGQDSYDDARSKSVSGIGRTEESIPSDATENVSHNSEGTRSSVCDYQDMDTGHVCGETFNSLSSLSQHWWHHSWVYRPLKCERESNCVYSKRGFTTESERDRHYSSAHAARDNRPFKCSVTTCLYHKKGFESQSYLSLHEKAHSLDFEEYHPCTVSGCPFEAHRKEDITAHMEEIHGVIDETMLTYEETRPRTANPRLRPSATRPPRSDASGSRTRKPKVFKSDTKQDSQSQSQSQYRASEEKAEILRQYIGSTDIDYRPFKCQVRGCKFLREGFETQSELVSHEDKEHNGQRSMLTTRIDAGSPCSEVVDSQFGALTASTRENNYSTTSGFPRSSADFLQCNNRDCPESFTLEQDWRKHCMTCKIKSGIKQCSFSDCQATFDNTKTLSSHEFGSHGIRICSSLTCNRAFHQFEDAENHMRDLHSNLYHEGRRPRLAFIASVPAWNEEIGETGFPYDPYRCALLNISQDKAFIQKGSISRQTSIKGKEVASDAYSHPTTAVILEDPQIRTRNMSESSRVEILPRYSAIMGTSSHMRSPLRYPLDQVESVTAERADKQINRPTTRLQYPARKPLHPLTSSTDLVLDTPLPNSSAISPSVDISKEGRNPRYRYNADGSRYVTGAVILSPDKHQVLVLRTKNDSKKIVYSIPSGLLEVNEKSMEASALWECWQNAGIIGRILRAIEPAPAEEPDENGLADWHSYFEVEVEKEQDIWPRYQLWQRRWLTYREARVVLSSQPDLIRALERSTIFKRGNTSSSSDTANETSTPLRPNKIASPARKLKGSEEQRPRRRQQQDDRPPITRKYTTVSPATDNIAAWRRDILPWLRRNFSTVMGKNKNGAIELLRVRNKPTICITCSDPKELDLDSFVEVVSDLFPMHIKVGLLTRSARSEHLDNYSLDDDDQLGEDVAGDPLTHSDDEHNENEEQNTAQTHDKRYSNKHVSVSYLDDDEDDMVPSDDEQDRTSSRPEKVFRSPPVFGKYQTRPSCGATVGLASEEEGTSSAGTFGGVVILVKPDGTEAPYGLISHHVIEAKSDDTELGIGVDEGWLINSTGAHRFPIQQPAKMDLEEAKDSLDMQRYYCDREKRYCDVDDGRAVRTKLATLDGLDQQYIDFGHVAYSSGYGFDANRHQMDWALIGDVPSWRLEDNIVPGTQHFYDLHYDGTPKAPYPVEKSFFGFLAETFEQEQFVDLSEIDPLRRIHGVGSYSGIMDGIVSSETAFFRLDGMDSEEWFFTPRYKGGLGVKGDSGTWIFDDFGKVVGQIIAYNYRTDTAYFTRMDYLFEHIKSKTRASEVYIPYKGELAKWKTEEIAKQNDSTRSGSVTDASSSYVDSSFGTTKTNDTEITSPMMISDSGLGYANFPIIRNV